MNITEKFYREGDGYTPPNHSLKPSEIAREGLIQSNEVIRRALPVEPPTLIRFYLGTHQRVPLSHLSLNSRAAYLLVCDSLKTIMGWIGSECKPTDRQLAIVTGIKILRYDYGLTEVQGFTVINEDEEYPLDLRFFLDQLYTDEKTYRGKIVRGNRMDIIHNSNVVISIMEKIGTAYVFREHCRGVRDNSGSIPRLSFPTVDRPDLIVVIKCSEEWDMWVSEGISSFEQDLAHGFLVSYITSRRKARIFRQNQDIPTNEEVAITSLSGTSEMDILLASKSIRITRQGCERYLFRQRFLRLTDFEPLKEMIKKSCQVSSALSLSSKEEENNQLDFSENNLSKHIQSQEILSSSTSGMLGPPSVSVRKLRQASVRIPASSSHPPGLSSGHLNGLTSDKIESIFAKVMASIQKDKYYQGSRLLTSDMLLRQKPPPNYYLNQSESREEKTQDEDENENDPYFRINRQVDLIRDDINRINLPTEIHAEVEDDNNLDHNPSERLSLMEVSAENPSILLGWLVEVDDGIFSGLHVITGMKKSFLARKSYYRLSSLTVEDIWVRLRRSSSKTGLSFRPIRRVLDLT